MLERQEGKKMKSLLGSGKLQNNPGLGFLAGTVSQFGRRAVASKEERDFRAAKYVEILLGEAAWERAEHESGK